MPSIPLDTHLREQGLFKSRVIAASVIVVILMLALVARLATLQWLQHAHYATRSDNNRLNIQVMPPHRGLIYDRNGRLLAENRPSYDLVIVPDLVKDLDTTIDRLADLIAISTKDRKRFKRLRRRHASHEGIPLRHRLSDEEVARFAVNRHHFNGVDIEARLTRHYPLGAELAHVIGYVGRISDRDLKRIDQAGETRNYKGTSHIGKIGIEAAFEKQLHGEVGYRRVEVNANGRVVKLIEEHPPRPGDDLYLSIDIGLQETADQALGDRKGAVVAIAVDSGEILALVSKPNYDPNLFVNGISTKAYAKLRDDPARPLFNRALRGAYPPGSTVKPFFGLASLELGVNTTERKMFAGPYYQLPGDDHRYRDWKKTGHGWVNLTKAIVQSCDVYFYDLATTLGIDRMSDYMHAFGLGQKTQVDVGGEVAGLFPSRQWKRRKKSLSWYPGETVITGIGQGYTQTTPIQLAMATATLANFGQGFVPHLVHASHNPTEKQTHLVAPNKRPAIPVRDRHNWQDVIEAMRQVIHAPNGTARRLAKGIDYQIAGKTGTAQVFTVKQDAEYQEKGLANHLRDHALFIAFAPVKKPQIAIAVVIENGGHGGSAAAPVAGAMFKHYFAQEKQHAMPQAQSSTQLSRRTEL